MAISFNFDEIDSLLLPLGFIRNEHVYFRFVRDAGLESRIEGISFRFQYNMKNVWLLITVKYPALLTLLSEVRPFAYLKENAWIAPDFASHVTAMITLADLGAAKSFNVAHYGRLTWKKYGRIRRTQNESRYAIVKVMAALIQEYVLPALGHCMSIQKIASATDYPQYSQSRLAGAWPLAARIALGDLHGAAKAFRLHQHSLGSDLVRVNAAKSWLCNKGIDVSAVNYKPWAKNVRQDAYEQSWLNGYFLALQPVYA